MRSLPRKVREFVNTKQRLSDDRRLAPIPPLSVVQFVWGDKRNPSVRKDLGRVFRIGCYSPQDGLDCIWLVNNHGKYEQTVDHEYLYKYFDVIQFVDHENWYGRRRPQIPPIDSLIDESNAAKGMY